MASKSPIKTFKCVFVGDGGVGKTSYLEKLRTGKFEKKYIATLGVVVHPIHVVENVCTFNCWDTAGQEKFGGFRDGYYINANCGVVFTDFLDSGKINTKGLATWHRDVRRVCPSAHLVIVVNKWDILKAVNDKKMEQGDFPSTLASHITLNDEKLRVFYITTRDDNADLRLPLSYLLGKMWTSSTSTPKE